MDPGRPKATPTASAGRRCTAGLARHKKTPKCFKKMKGKDEKEMKNDEKSKKSLENEDVLKMSNVAFPGFPCLSLAHRLAPRRLKCFQRSEKQGEGPPQPQT